MGASSLSLFRQHFPSCQIHPVVELHDVDSKTPATISAAAETMPATESADDMPVRVPLQLGFLLLRSLSDTAPTPVSDPPSPSDAACSVLLAYLSHNLRLPVNSVTFRYPQPLHRTRFMYMHHAPSNSRAHKMPAATSVQEAAATAAFSDSWIRPLLPGAAAACRHGCCAHSAAEARLKRSALAHT